MEAGLDGVALSQIVGALASIIFPTPHKIQNDDRLPQYVSGVSGWMSLLVLAHLGSPDHMAVKRLHVCVLLALGASYGQMWHKTAPTTINIIQLQLNKTRGPSSG